MHITPTSIVYGNAKGNAILRLDTTNTMAVLLNNIKTAILLFFFSCLEEGASKKKQTLWGNSQGHISNAVVIIVIANYQYT